MWLKICLSACMWSDFVRRGGGTCGGTTLDSLSRDTTVPVAITVSAPVQSTRDATSNRKNACFWE